MRTRKEIIGELMWGAALGLVLASALFLGGCWSFGLDNTSSGGGRWSFDTYHPCLGPNPEKPIGGNTGIQPNETTRGGNAKTGE